MRNRIKCSGTCGGIVHVSKLEYDEVERSGKLDSYECVNCRSVIFTKNYPPGRITVFAPIGLPPLGTALGDFIHFAIR